MTNRNHDRRLSRLETALGADRPQPALEDVAAAHARLCAAFDAGEQSVTVFGTTITRDQWDQAKQFAALEEGQA